MHSCMLGWGWGGRVGLAWVTWGGLAGPGLGGDGPSFALELLSSMTVRGCGQGCGVERLELPKAML